MSSRLPNIFQKAIILGACLLHSAAGFGQVSDVLERVPPEIRKASDIDRLTPDERSVLNQWLGDVINEEVSIRISDLRKKRQDGRRPAIQGNLVKGEEERRFGREKVCSERKRRSSGEKEESQATRREVRDLKKKVKSKKAIPDEEVLVSRMKEPFTSWSGTTRFYLQNGQEWEQFWPAFYTHHGESHSVVEIRRKGRGYLLILPDFGSKLRVR